MSDLLEGFKEKISKRHKGDDQQLKVIFSDSPRLLVEAPAGYGKTNTMVSKIAYMLATGQIPNPKRLLALTFSINAAYKIKKDSARQLPELLEGFDTKASQNKVIVSNYHGFCRGVLRKYGSLLQTSLSNIDRLQALDDDDAQKTMAIVKGIGYDEAMSLANYSAQVKAANKPFLLSNLSAYNSDVIRDVLPKGVIPYNAILTLTLQLLENHASILDFYRSYFVAILVDEYQDTNELSHRLLSLLVSPKTRLILFGDSLQRIYGFIGAVPNLLATSKQEFNLSTIELCTNHRFASNPGMLLLDSNIRRIAENPSKPQITKEVTLNLKIYEDQEAEASSLVNKAASLVSEHPDATVAILVRQRGPNTQAIVKAFASSGIPFFYGLFSDDDVSYTQFHNKCLHEFVQLFRANSRVTRPMSNLHIAKMKKLYENNTGPLETALFSLLEMFWSRIFTEYAFLTNEDKLTFIRDTFEYNSLKQYIEFTDKRIILSTIHAGKGLEWDFVLLSDMEQYQLPNYQGLCGQCNCKWDCHLQLKPPTMQPFLEELSLFYVAVTRAKQPVFFSASRTRLDYQGTEKSTNLSCFLSLPGLKSPVY